MKRISMRGAALLRLLAAVAISLEERGVDMRAIPDPVDTPPAPRAPYKPHQGAKERARRLKRMKA